MRAHMHMFRIELCAWYCARGYTSVHTRILRRTLYLHLLTLSPNHLCIIVSQIRLAQAGPCFVDTLKLHLSSCSETAVWNQMSCCFHLYQGLSLQEIRSWPITGNAVSRPHCCEITLSSAAKNAKAEYILYMKSNIFLITANCMPNFFLTCKFRLCISLY